MGEQLAIDYAWEHPGPAAIPEAGYTAVLRYLSNDPTKDLTAAEASQLHAVGLGIGVIWETTAEAALGGIAAGQLDGATMRARLEALGAPPGIPAIVNLGDWSVQHDQLGAIQAYYTAFREQLDAYNAGAGGYGPGGLIAYLAQHWPADLWWQNAITALGVDGNTVVSAASIYQRVTPTRALTATAGNYDEDVYGFGPQPLPRWWQPGAATPPPQPAPGDDMQVPLTIQQGSAGPEVRNAQALLFARGYRLGSTGVANSGIDSEFGQLTRAAVVAYQEYVKITPDGIVGPITWGHLLGSV